MSGASLRFTAGSGVLRRQARFVLHASPAPRRREDVSLCGIETVSDKAAFSDDFRRKLCRRSFAAATHTSNARRPIGFARLEHERVIRATPA